MDEQILKAPDVLRIKSIRLANIATYGTTPEILNGLSKSDFLFGSNGFGKT